MTSRYFITTLSLCVFVLALWANSPDALAEEPTVTDTRLGVHPDKTRFVIDVSSALDFTIFTLEDPYRVVIDLPEVTWQLEPGQELLGKGLIAGYRYGLFRPGNSRIVLDVTAPVSVESAKSMIPNGDRGYRLVIDLAETDGEAFAKTAGWPERRVSQQAAAEPPIPLRDPSKSDPNRKMRVILDPGHGGIDSGAVGVDGTFEKDIALETSKKIKEVIEATGRYDVFLTREDDRFLELKERVEIARNFGGDLFISIHADSLESKKVSGASVYTLSEEASDKEAEELAQKENRADLIAGIDLENETDTVTDILIELAQRETMNRSADFARVLTGNIREHTQLLRNPHRFAGFRVLKAPDIPSVLVELGYLSNQADEALLTSEKWRKSMAEGIRDAVNQFFAEQTGSDQQKSASHEP